MEYKNLEQELIKVGEFIRDSYKEKLIAGGVYATGNLYNSIGYRLDITTTGIVLKFIALDYYIDIEEGRAPNSKMPPIDVIRKWMISRGIPDKPGTAFLIARSIGIKGIRPKPYFREVRIQAEEYIPKIKAAIEADIKIYADNKFTGIIKEQIKN